MIIIVGRLVNEKKKSYRMGAMGIIRLFFILFVSFWLGITIQGFLCWLFFSRFFCGMVLDLQEVKMNVTRLFCLLHGNN